MRRRSLTNILSNQELSLDDAWRWYAFQRTLIGDEKSRVATALISGAATADPRYFGKSSAELDEFFEFQIAELEKCAMLGMLSSTEAALFVDFIVRVKNKNKDAVSRAFRNASKNRGDIESIRLDEDILNSLRDHSQNKPLKDIVAAFKGALYLRHWLAHGRYRQPKKQHIYDYNAQDIFGICKKLIDLVIALP